MADKQGLLYAEWESYLGKLSLPSKEREDNGRQDRSRDSSTWEHKTWLTVPEAAEELKCTTRTVYRYVKKGKLTKTSPGRISVASLKGFLDIGQN